METIQTDVVIVGASVAGNAAAAMFAREGLRVLIVDRVREATAYKKQCTHYIQAAATPVFERLGLIEELEAAGAVRNSLSLWTDAGWLQLASGERDEEGRRIHGYTLRRERLDPILRENARRTEGVTMKLGTSVVSLIEAQGRVIGVELETEGVRARVEAKLVVGADGRSSKVAELSGIETETTPHNRGGFFAYFKNVGMKKGPDAQFWILGEDVAYAFPSDYGLVCLTLAVNERKLPEFRADKEAYLRRAFEKLPLAPDLSQAQRVTDFVGVANTPNTYRYPTKPGLALIGDAAMASDYIWGVGCGWALQGAEFLVNHAAPALRSGGDVDAALVAYAEQHKATLYPLHAQNTGFSASDKLPLLQRGIFGAAVNDARLRELLAMSLRGKLGARDLRIPLRVAMYFLMKPFRRAAPAVLATRAA